MFSRLGSIVISRLTNTERTAVDLAVKRNVAGLRNFHEVTPWLFRGGQPTHEGFQQLKAMGVKTVISFRWGRRINQAERNAVESLGMTYVSLPLNYWNLPTQEMIDQFLSILDNPENAPIYAHCFHGADRTGILFAIYRMTRMDWSVDEAYFEMKRCGFHRFRLRHFKWLLWSYARRATKATGNNRERLSVNRY